MKAIIIDGYVDEPACFGVPPYISPYIRYIAGALRENGFQEENIHYFTIDDLRKDLDYAPRLIRRADITIVLSGMTVPGKYLRSTPINLGEIQSIFSATNGIKVLGGPIRLGFSLEGGKAAQSNLTDSTDACICSKDIEAFVADITGKNTESPEDVEHRFRSVEEIRRWSNKGSFIIKKHPDYPNVMCEIETYRGCGRKHHCSFCTEPSYGESDYRPIMDVVSEVSELYKNGARFFRIGRQPDILSYQAKDKGGNTPEPDPEAILSLYRGIRNVAPELKVLHMDNANPGTIANYPELSREILKTIVKYHTPGDIAALGMESADPEVVRANGLKAFQDEIFEAISIINEIGRNRGANGMPELLPGINIVHGLMGESKKTFQLNYEFLKRVFDSDLLLRRINIRQVMAFPGTRIYGNDELVKKHKQLFLKYKEMIRRDIDMPMLKKIIPSGTILRDVMCELNSDKLCFGRQMGSYPLLIGIPANQKIGEYIDVTVTRHGHRSITGVPYPLKINTAPISLIQELPGIGKKQATKIYKKLPFENEEDFMNKTSKEELLKYIDLS
ncbi:radical SAM protein [Methanolobus bombayensis]|uniref:radical SAM protein n=1 Tax=Methanolobus bombayensis TaxID=38023 RepID=UPI001AE467D6|nr:radical SAM protein [Methanolobus bombayensis]MBP1908670.1 radical SAM superfamily enzyme with C-terminal helix-hairpin-helix motif [Methanolobus bombayensis]